jgi:hypothetical protein
MDEQHAHVHLHGPQDLDALAAGGVTTGLRPEAHPGVPQENRGWPWQTSPGW